MVQWPAAINHNAFSMSTNVEDNLVKVQFESGKTRTFLKNSACKKSFTFSLMLKDVGENSEYKLFWKWYDGVLLSGTETFLFPDLITHVGDGLTTGTEYRMTATPSASGQKFKTVQLSVVEE